MIYWAKIDGAKEQSFSVINNKKLAANETKAFSFSANQYNKLNWSEQDEEFTYNGQCYDIMKIQHSNGQINITCYTDNAETEIANAFNSLLQKFFSPVQQSKNTENNIAAKIYKEYLPIKHTAILKEELSIISFVTTKQAYTSCSAISDIWHPPAATC